MALRSVPNPGAGQTAHELPPLPYDFAALEPHIDAQTMQIHHDKHHGAYVTNLNAALDKHPDLESKSRRRPAAQPRLRSGGHPHRGPQQRRRPRQPLHVLEDHGAQGRRRSHRRHRRRDRRSFGGFEPFKEKFNDTGVERFGSGWAWLVRTSAGKLGSCSAPPTRTARSWTATSPVFGIDVWEHAYYLKYQNRRADYLKAWWNVVNWDEINRRLKQGR